MRVLLRNSRSPFQANGLVQQMSCVSLLVSLNAPLGWRRFCVSSPQVEELYETYCIQWRLCQGAVNMKRAFSLSPSTRASRESLLELNRNHRHSLQVLCGFTPTEILCAPCVLTVLPVHLLFLLRMRWQDWAPKCRRWGRTGQRKRPRPHVYRYFLNISIFSCISSKQCCVCGWHFTHFIHVINSTFWRVIKRKKAD